MKIQSIKQLNALLKNLQMTARVTKIVSVEDNLGIAITYRVLINEDSGVERLCVRELKSGRYTADFLTQEA